MATVRTMKKIILSDLIAERYDRSSRTVGGNVESRSVRCHMSAPLIRPPRHAATKHQARQPLCVHLARPRAAAPVLEGESNRQAGRIRFACKGNLRRTSVHRDLPFAAPTGNGRLIWHTRCFQWPRPPAAADIPRVASAVCAPLRTNSAVALMRAEYY